MKQVYCTTYRKKYKHLIEKERYKLEGYLESKVAVKEISIRLNSHISTIYREIKRGFVVRLKTDLTEHKVYRANVAQCDHEAKVAYRERSLKIDKDKELENYIREKISKAKYSPDVLIGEIKKKGLKFKGIICVKTLYNYIDRGFLCGISNLNLWEKRKKKFRKKKQKPRVSLRNRDSRSIEERNPDINDRLEYGHWEGDCVKGARGEKEGLFTLSERKTRKEIILKIKSISQIEIKKALDEIESKYGIEFCEQFKTITFDNGGEFLDWKSIERSAIDKDKKRTEVYFAHPYSSWERGTNENQNRMIRRFIPKGKNIAKISKKEIEKIENWMNNYPRKILGYKTANEMVLELTSNKKVLS